MMALLFSMTRDIAKTLLSLLALPSPSQDEANRVIMELGLMACRINRLLADAEDRVIRDESEKIRLAEFRYAAYRIELVLEDFEYEKLRARNELQVIDSSFLNDILRRANVVNQELDGIIRSWQNLILTDQDGLRIPLENYARPTASLFDDPVQVIGRGTEQRMVTAMLLGDDPPCKIHQGVAGGSSVSRIKLVAIAGIGGIGKTTVARLVYNDSKVHSHFDVKSWVWVSQFCDIIRLTRALVESVTNAPCNLVELESLQNTLVEVVRGKKILLLLDDVWDDVSILWEMLQLPLVLAAASGSSVVVTTRNKYVATLTGAQSVVNLNGLNTYDSWRLFWQVVLSHDNKTAEDVTLEMKAVGQRIIDKSHGVPLVVRAVGAMLSRNMSLDFWEGVAASDLWELDMRKEQVMPILKLSYNYLPAHLKPCFRFCGQYPRGHEFKVEELCRLWCALGFVHDNGRNKMEDIASSYIDELVQVSFLSRSAPLVVVMLDLIYDLAQSIATRESFSSAHDGSYDVHSNVFLDDISEMDHRNCSMRSILINIRGCEGHTYYIERNLFKSVQLQNLKVLDMSNDFANFHWTEINLPESVGELKHLRYLSMCQKTIPDFICKLYKLQTIVNHCADTLYLPECIWKLNGLRSLLFPRMSPAVMPWGICRLTNLQSLSAFTVSTGSSDTASLCALGNLDRLQGDLRILELQNITKKRIWEAAEANLSNKRLTQLSLEWIPSHSGDSTPYPDEEVLEYLQPNSWIRCFRVSGYRGDSFPAWLSHHSFQMITKVEIIDCNNSKYLPALGQLTSLNQLKLEGLKNIKVISAEFYGNARVPFPSLRQLQFFGMQLWETWWPSANLGAFPVLQELVLMDCQELVSLPICNLHALVELTVIGCKQLTTLKQIEHHCKLVIKETFAGKSQSGVKSHDKELCFRREAPAQQPYFFPSLATVRTEDWCWRSRVGFRRFWHTRYCEVV